MKPTEWPSSALVVGAGRAGTSLARALAKAGIDTTLHSRTKRPKTRGVSGTYGPIPTDAFELVVLATPDGTIADVARTLPPATAKRRPTAIHLAGALGLEVLDPLESKGYGTGSLHLLQSIATPRTKLEGCPAGIVGGTPRSLADLLVLADRLGLVPLQPKHARAAYHAAACVAGNDVQVLVEASLRLFESAGLDRPDALLAVERLARSALDNAITLGPARGLTGPIARGDAETVKRHLDAIEDAEVFALYVAAGRIAVQLAESRGVDVAAVEALLKRR